jgi:hypothetical protein
MTDLRIDYADGVDRIRRDCHRHDERQALTYAGLLKLTGNVPAGASRAGVRQGAVGRGPHGVREQAAQRTRHLLARVGAAGRLFE